MDEDPKLPTLGDWLSGLLGFQLPAVSLPQTLKNADKAIAKVVLALGENLEARVKANTARRKALGKIRVSDLFSTPEDARKFENRLAATKVAIDDLNAQPPTKDAAKEIEDDWLNWFARASEDKTSEELRLLFGRILAGEIRRPGSFSLRTVQILSTISKEDAEKLSKLLSFGLEGEGIPMGHDDFVPYSERLLLEELGVASHPTGLGGTVLELKIAKKSSYLLRGVGLGLLIENGTEQEVELKIAAQALTSSARELMTIANPPPTPLEFLMAVGKGVLSDLQQRYPDQFQRSELQVAIGTFIIDAAGQEASFNRIQYVN